MEKITKKNFLAELAALATSLRRQIEAECDAFPVDAEASRQRRTKAQGDFAYFRSTYFPHYTTSFSKGHKAATDDGQSRSASAAKADSLLHLYFDEVLPAAIDALQGVKIATAAPRGEAKTTFVSLFFALWCVVTGRKRYILLIADALEQAASFLEAIKVELEANPRLSADFPAHVGQGRVWNVGTIVTAANVKIQAFGAGKRMRGLRHGPARPDLALLDDLENDENVRKPEQRDKLEKWLLRTVLSLGPADDSMDVVYVGTILHYDSVLARTLKKSTWRGKTFRAIVQMPSRMDLWDKWEAILTAEGPDKARFFYDDVGLHPEKYTRPLFATDGEQPRSGSAAKATSFANDSESRTESAVERHLMNYGASVSWPAFRPLYSLMLKRAEDRAAFDAEQQNDPLPTDGAPFATCIIFWHELPTDLLLFGSCDPSMGKAGAGRDPSALLVGGFQRSALRLFVLEAQICKRHPDRIISDMIALQQQYKCLLWAVETVQFQAFFADVLVREAAAQGLLMPVRPVNNSTDKYLRIESLQPYCVQKRIVVHPSHHTLIDQMRHFPMADHDDGPDALEMLWRVASTGFVSLQDAFVRVPRPQSFFGTKPDCAEPDFENWN